MRKVLRTILSIIIIISFIMLPVSAATGNEVHPLWDNTLSVKANISFSGTTGTYSANIFGHSNATDIIAFAKLYYKNTSGDWVEIPMPWGFISTTKDMYITESFTAQSGVEYKVDLEATVYDNYYGEVINYTTSNTCP